MTEVSGLPGLLLTITSCPAAHRDATARWLGDQLAQIAALDGVRNARLAVHTDLSFKPVENDDAPVWMSYYDVEPQRLQSLIDALHRTDTVAAETKEPILTTVRREHRAYRPVPTPAIARAEDRDICGEVLNCVGWEPAAGTEAELDRWYDEEHIPLLMSIPTWQRVRRFERTLGTGPRYLALHDVWTVATAQRRGIDTTTVAERSQAPGMTEWRGRVVAQRRQFETTRYAVTKRIG